MGSESGMGTQLRIREDLQWDARPFHSSNLHLHSFPAEVARAVLARSLKNEER